MTKRSTAYRTELAAPRWAGRVARPALGAVLLPAFVLAAASSTVGAQSSDLATDQVSADSLPDCQATPFHVRLDITAIELLVDESHANVSRQEMASYIVKALRQTDLFAGVHHESQDESELVLLIDSVELRYRSDPVEPHLRLEADVELTWRDGGELYWRSRYVVESSYGERTPGRHGQFNLNLRMATRKFAARMAQDLNKFFLAEGLAKVSFRRDVPDGQPLARVAMLEVEHASRTDLLRRASAMVSTSLCLEPVDTRSAPAREDQASVLAQRFGIQLDDSTVSLALVVAPWLAKGTRVTAVDLHRDIELGTVEWEEPNVEPEIVERQLQSIVGALMRAHHSTGSCHRQEYAHALGECETPRSAIHFEP